MLRRLYRYYKRFMLALADTQSGEIVVVVLRTSLALFAYQIVHLDARRRWSIDSRQ